MRWGSCMGSIHLHIQLSLSHCHSGTQYASYSKLHCTSWSIVSTCVSILLPLPPSFWFADIFRILLRIRQPTLIIVEYLWWVCETFPDDIIANEVPELGVQGEYSAFSKQDMYLFLHIALAFANPYQCWSLNVYMENGTLALAIGLTSALITQCNI